MRFYNKLSMFFIKYESLKTEISTQSTFQVRYITSELFPMGRRNI